MKKLQWIACLIPLGLVACQDTTPLAALCQQQPQLCQDLNDRGWCNASRAALIRSRAEAGVPPSPDGQLAQLVLLSEHVECMASVAQVVSTSGSLREHWYLQANQSLEQRLKDTAEHPDPSLSLYHWMHFKNQAGLERFLEGEAKGQVSGEIGHRLAGLYFSGRDPEKTRHHLLQYLLLAPQQASKSPLEWDSLSQAYTALGKPEQAFLFAALAHRKDRSFSANALARHHQLDPRQVPQLMAKVELIEQGLKSGQWDPKQFNL
ncbi:DUF2989 domain-containing protein [Ferrimonas marina]|uniref:DUF2989 domain-containing protein n=1 Tax=Ferrimonas marina TaxID=299255 RepID=A0A1M5NAK7_9GAMM|nr:DUF2989 domain-containing protein [Ferrimonas marina]SHG86023.1 Protein of unknown function [Ferrimonas marina]